MNTPFLATFSDRDMQEFLGWVFSDDPLPTVRASLLGDLRAPCAPGERPSPGSHKHTCDSCRTSWQHSDELPRSDISVEAHAEAHTCPRCGDEQYYKG